MMGLWQRRTEGVVIDLREAAVARRHHPVWGQPNPCPDCGGPAYLEHIDVRHHVQEQRCKQCGLVFETADPAAVTDQEA